MDIRYLLREDFIMPQPFAVPAVPGFLAGPWRWRIALFVGLTLSLGFSSGLPAASTWTVCASGCDYSNIKAAIAASTTLDGDMLAIGAGTYTKAGTTVNKSLTLQGAGAASTIVQATATPGIAPDRVFHIIRGVTVTIQQLTIRHGSARSGGGLWNQGTLTLTNSVVSSNSSSFEGGGLFNEGTLTLTNSMVSSNSSSSGGGGLFNSSGTLTLTHSIVSDNSAYYGGGLLNTGGTLTLTDSTVSGNSSLHAQGGGLDNQIGTLTLTRCTVSGNTADAVGGGLYIQSGTVTLTNSTVSSNSSSFDGGGLFNGAGSLMLINSTISGNSAGRYGGGLYNGRTVTLTNSIIANHASGGDCANFSGGPITSEGYNLDSDGSCHLTAPTDRSGDPLLGPLQDNGGPTVTQALLPGSPAIDAIPWGTNGCGTTVISDQRWQARPQPAGGACDIGAYEVAVAGQAIEAWVAGFTPHSVTCKNVTIGQVVTLSDPASPWDCEAAGLGVSSGAQVALHVRGHVQKGARDVGGAVVGMAPSGGGCTNLTTGQQVQFQALFQGVHGATAASCVEAGLVVHPGDTVQMRVQGVAE
jgi:hypothetical protein